MNNKIEELLATYYEAALRKTPKLLDNPAFTTQLFHFKQIPTIIEILIQYTESILLVRFATKPTAEDFKALAAIYNLARKYNLPELARKIAPSLHAHAYIILEKYVDTKLIRPDINDSDARLVIDQYVDLAKYLKVDTSLHSTLSNLITRSIEKILASSGPLCIFTLLLNLMNKIEYTINSEVKSLFFEKIFSKNFDSIDYFCHAISDLNLLQAEEPLIERAVTNFLTGIKTSFWCATGTQDTGTLYWLLYLPNSFVVFETHIDLFEHLMKKLDTRYRDTAKNLFACIDYVVKYALHNRVGFSHLTIIHNRVTRFLETQISEFNNNPPRHLRELQDIITEAINTNSTSMLLPVIMRFLTQQLIQWNDNNISYDHQELFAFIQRNPLLEQTAREAGLFTLIEQASAKTCETQSPATPVVTQEKPSKPEQATPPLIHTIETPVQRAPKSELSAQVSMPMQTPFISPPQEESTSPPVAKTKSTTTRVRRAVSRDKKVLYAVSEKKIYFRNTSTEVSVQEMLSALKTSNTCTVYSTAQAANAEKTNKSERGRFWGVTTPAAFVITHRQKSSLENGAKLKEKLIDTALYIHEGTPDKKELLRSRFHEKELRSIVSKAYETYETVSQSTRTTSSSIMESMCSTSSTTDTETTTYSHGTPGLARALTFKESLEGLEYVELIEKMQEYATGRFNGNFEKERSFKAILYEALVNKYGNQEQKDSLTGSIIISRENLLSAIDDANRCIRNKVFAETTVAPPVTARSRGKLDNC